MIIVKTCSCRKDVYVVMKKTKEERKGKKADSEVIYLSSFQRWKKMHHVNQDKQLLGKKCEVGGTIDGLYLFSQDVLVLYNFYKVRKEML